MNKIEEAEMLVDALLIEGFDASMEVSNALGHYNVNWTQCYNNRCSKIELSFDKDVCKQSCIISAASSSIAELSGVRSMCGENKRPAPCLKRLDKGIKKLRDKIAKARDKQRKSRDKKAEYLRKVGGGA